MYIKFQSSLDWLKSSYHLLAWDDKLDGPETISPEGTYQLLSGSE
jgi:hypothetical protein